MATEAKETNRMTSSPYELACDKHGTKQVLEVVESVLTADRSSQHGSDRTTEALLSLALDEAVALDGVYFLLRREPGVLPKHMSPPRNNDDDRDTHGNNNTEPELSAARRRRPKRKRMLNAFYWM